MDSDRQRIRALVDRWVAVGRSRHPAREPPYPVEDGGAPPAMWDRPPDAAGYVSWVPIDSPVTDADLDRIERRVGTALPPLVRAWLSTVSMGSLENGRARLHALWSDAPLRRFERAIEDWSPLERAGYVVIGDAENDIGPLCLDLGTEGAPLVAFDHEELFDLGGGRTADRTLVSPLARPRWPSFSALCDELEAELSSPPLPG